MTFETVSSSLNNTLRIATTLGRKLSGGEVLELVGDLGSGKTVFVRGLAAGIDSRDQVQSPTFTLSRIYRGRGLEIHHFDFYRLQEPGVVKEALAEVIGRPKTIVAIEWGEAVLDVLPKERLQITLTPNDENSRTIQFKAIGKNHEDLIKVLR